MSAHFIIAPATKGDARALSRIHSSAFPSDPWGKGALEDLFEMPGIVSLMATGPDGPRGFVLARQAVDEAEIITLAVHAKARRIGLGAALMRGVMNRLIQTGVRGLFLEVAADNPAALNLYAGLGFERAGVRPKYYVRPDGPVDAVLMKRNL